EKKDDLIATLVEHFDLGVNYEDTYAFTRLQALQMNQNKSRGEIIDTIISKFKTLEEAYDFTVIESSDFIGEGIVFELSANISIAKNLSAPVIIVISGENKTTAQVVTTAITVVQNFQSSDVEVLAVVVNKVNIEQAKDVEQLLAMQLNNMIVAVIPF